MDRVKRPLQGEVAVVTGAGSGIGRALSLALGEAGVSVMLVGRRRAALVGTAELMAAHGVSAIPVEADITDDADRQRILARVEDAEQGLDILVHSAGAYRAAPLVSAPLEDLDCMFDVHVRGPCILNQLFLPHLRASQGQIVFVNSSIVHGAVAGTGYYASTMHARRCIADVLRIEINADGVRVLSVNPGRTATPLQRRVFAAEGRDYRPERLVQPSDVASATVHALSLPRTAEVTEISLRPMLKP